jgi:hypothetical protein
LQLITKIVSSHTADSKLVKTEVNGTVILSPLVFPDMSNTFSLQIVKMGKGQNFGHLKSDMDVPTSLIRNEMAFRVFDV